MKDITALIGRILLSLIFLSSLISKITNFQGTLSYMQSYKMIFAPFFLICAILFEGIGGLSLFSGFLTRYGSLLLIIFLIPTTIIFHTNFSDQSQSINFMKNVAIMGGLLYVFSYGAGKISLDNLIKKSV
jgi:putative oxidoreductase